MRKLITCMLLPLAFMVAACGGGDRQGIVFVTNDVLGFKVGPSAAGGVDTIFGWGEQNFGYVPTEHSDGTPAMSKIVGVDGSTSEDALSVLGQFEANADVTEAEVVLGRFFSIGQAAVQLSTGFRDKLAGSGPVPE